MGSVNSKVDRDFIHEYYKKRNEFNKLRRELDEMSAEIKEYMSNEGVGHKRIGGYTINIKRVHRVNSKFISLLRETGNENAIQESCLMDDFRRVCDTLGIDDNSKEEYLDLWYKQLGVHKHE